MKHILIISAISVVIISCKKQYNCKCTDSQGNESIYTMEEGTKAQNKAECNSFELPGEITCELVE